MPAPFNYVVDQPDANSYFDAVRRGRADQQAVVQEQRNNALAKYLPQALNGDEGARQQALTAGSPDQMIQLKQMFTQMDAPKLAAVKDLRAKGAAGATWAKTPEQWATVQATLQAEAQAAGVPFKEVPFEQKDAMAAMGQTVDSLIDQAYKEKMLANDTSRTQAQNAASYASAAASRALADNRVAAPVTLPTRLQAAEDDDIGAIQTVQSINAQLDAINGQIDSGELDLGPINNLISRGQNYAGASNEGSTNYATMMSTLEKMRNDSLILNKGVQTEGDAVRAWNALIANVNDPKVVKAQIMRIKRLNGIASQQKLQLINVRRARNGAQPFDPSQIAAPTGATTPPPVAPAAQSAPATPAAAATSSTVIRYDAKGRRVQ